MHFDDNYKLENIIIDKYSFISLSTEKAEFIFSTANNNLNFNKSSTDGKNNIENIKKWFKVVDTGCLNQIHSCLIHEYDGKIYDGDALINIKKNIALGVFTADCIPILIADVKKGVSAAIHSGWRGTLDCIVLKTLYRLKNEYNIEPNDLKVVIGPHIRNCCYEVGEEIIEKFMDKEIYKNKNISTGRMLNLEECIKLQLKKFSIADENVYTVNICTNCSKDYKMHSYRREGKSAGRMFSFVIVR